MSRRDLTLRCAAGAGGEPIEFSWECTGASSAVFKAQVKKVILGTSITPGLHIPSMLENCSSFKKKTLTVVCLQGSSPQDRRQFEYLVEFEAIFHNKKLVLGYESDGWGRGGSVLENWS
jgi:hypothetical protein